MAKLYFRYGAMNCGKTVLLLQSVHNYEDRWMNVLVLKPKVDTKGGNKIVSRIGLEREVDCLVNSDEDLYLYLSKNIEGISCIFVDEAQFLKREQVAQLLQIVVFYDIPIICYGLRTDFRGNLFPGSSKLLGLAEELHEFKTLCNCGEIARYNARRVNGKYIVDGDSVLIDGTSDIEYVPLCASCYAKNILSIDK